MHTTTAFHRAAKLWIPLTTLALLATATSPSLAADSNPLLLWPDGAPGAKGDKPDDKPTLTIILPEPAKATGTAIVICPGGGYEYLAVGHEGHNIAAWLKTLGVAGFILEYRHRARGYGHPAPLQDVQRAIRLVRYRGYQWGIDRKRIGVIGFSAGGHLASTAGTHFDQGDRNASDPIDRVSCRPDFMILCYPVIALGKPHTHRGSQENLIGKDADAELVRSLSNETQVTADTPPTFLLHTDEDRVVPPQNSIDFYLALRRAKVPAELHIFRQGRHGLGLAAGKTGASNWPKCCEDWMRGLGLLGANR